MSNKKDIECCRLHPNTFVICDNSLQRRMVIEYLREYNIDNCFFEGTGNTPIGRNHNNSIRYCNSSDIEGKTITIFYKEFLELIKGNINNYQIY